MNFILSVLADYMFRSLQSSGLRIYFLIPNLSTHGLGSLTPMAENIYYVSIGRWGDFRTGGHRYGPEMNSGTSYQCSTTFVIHPINLLMSN